MTDQNPKRPPVPANRKAFDIFQPNKIRPQNTSRPIIVSNKPEQADPMMVERKQELKAPAKVQEPVEQEVPTAPELPSTEQKAAPRPTHETKPPKPEHKEVTINESVPKIDEALAKEEQSPEPTQQPKTPIEPASVEETEEPKESMPAAWKSLDSATIDDPIISIHHHQKKHRVLKWTLGILLFLFLIVVIIDILLDSGMWIPNFNLPHTTILQHIRESRTVNS